MTDSEHPVTDPTELTTKAVDRAVASMNDVLAVKFDAIEAQFQQVEANRIEQKQDTQKAVDAALAAQKEAVREQTAASEKAITKSENATAKEIAAMSSAFGTELTAMGDKIEALKERLVTMESIKAGGKEAYASLYVALAIIATLLGIGGVLYGLTR